MKKIAIYTAIFGNKDNLPDPEFIPGNCDFICFTDNDFKSVIWDIRKVSKVLDDPVRNARMYKVLAHKYLSDYEYSIWIDGNMIVRGDMNKLINRYLSNVNMAVFDHKNTTMEPRNSLYEEAEALINMAHKNKYKDDPEMIRKQANYYKSQGYPGDNGLVISMVLLRKHNEPDVVKTMDNWWAEITRFSRRDQMSFNYVAWKNNLDFVYMNGDSRDNDFFLWVPHKEKKYWDSPSQK